MKVEWSSDLSLFGLSGGVQDESDAYGSRISSGSAAHHDITLQVWLALSFLIKSIFIFILC